MLLKNNGHCVYVISSRDSGQSRYENIDGVNIYRVPLKKIRGGFVRYVFEYFAFFWLALFTLNILDYKVNFDAVHVNTLPDFLVFCTIFQKIKKIKIILDMHEIMPEFFMSKYGKNNENLIVRTILLQEKLSLLFADIILTVNDPIRDVFHKRAVPGKNITVVMNSVDDKLTASYRKKEHRFFNCVYHGTISKMYSIDMAIKAFEKACSDGTKDMRFHIIGNGPEKEYLEKLSHQLGVEDFVIFHGECNFEKVLEHLGIMDLGIISVKKDVFLDLSFSNKLAEYVHLKIPLAHSNIRTPMHYFNNREILFYDSLDVNDLAKKIKFAYTNKEKLNSFADLAYHRYEKYNWGIMQQKYLKAIKL